MSNLQNENVKEDLLDNVLEMTVDEFITSLEDLNLSGSNSLDSLISETVEKLFEQRGL